MQRPVRINLQGMAQTTCKRTGIPVWEVGFHIQDNEMHVVRTMVQVRASKDADEGDIVAQAWLTLGRISSAVATAQSKFAAVQQDAFESSPAAESQIERLNRARMAELKR